jgi:hypothetical protein
VSTPRYSINDKVIPFEFTVKIPPPRSERIILERDKEGRIINSIPPTPYEGKGDYNKGVSK